MTCQVPVNYIRFSNLESISFIHIVCYIHIELPRSFWKISRTELATNRMKHVHSLEKKRHIGGENV